MAISAFGRFWLCASTTKSTALWQKSAVRPSLAQNARTSFSALAPSAHFFTSNVNSSNLTPFHEGAPATSLGQPVEAARARTERRALADRAADGGARGDARARRGARENIATTDGVYRVPFGGRNAETRPLCAPNDCGRASYTEVLRIETSRWKRSSDTGRRHERQNALFVVVGRCSQKKMNYCTSLRACRLSASHQTTRPPIPARGRAPVREVAAPRPAS